MNVLQIYVCKNNYNAIQKQNLKKRMYAN